MLSVRDNSWHLVYTDYGLWFVPFAAAEKKTQPNRYLLIATSGGLNQQRTGVSYLSCTLSHAFFYCSFFISLVFFDMSSIHH